MDFQDAVAYLNSFINYEKKKNIVYDEDHYNLESFRALAGLFDRPHDAVPCFHVTGTKGKGSVVEFLKNMLMAQGFRVGTFTSPHLYNVRERIRIDDEWISEEDFAILVEKIRPATSGREKRYRTFFELITLMSFLYFREKQVDWAVYEVGMGGRLDSTNIIRPRCAVINTVSLDHTETLGPTLQHIAREKAGIVKPGVPVVIGPQQEGIAAYLEELALEAGGEPILFGKDFRTEGPYLIMGGEKFGPVKLAMRGEHQIRNCACAFQALLSAGVASGEKRSLVGAMEKTLLGGRIEERMFKGRLIVLDVGHTVESVQSLYNALKERYPEKELVSVVSYSQGKNLAGMLTLDQKWCRKVILTENSSFRSARVDDLRQAAREREGLMEEKDLESALESAIASAKPSDLIVIHGSFYLIGDLYEIMEKYQNQQ
ncbi:MAG TPA: bifunctional folylpolyglutamate synthase/dihydrofolate synthase [Desulfobacteraceae bacterium]|nr:bifunctional folylpolyglutamate synthase/dihydrofolate synthase [Desulfobacteraceae bacterium]